MYLSTRENPRSIGNSILEINSGFVERFVKKVLHNSESRVSSPGQRRSWGGHWWVFPVFQIYKKTRVEVFACLGSSHDFLSTIFGILRNFWVDIGKNFFQKIFFQHQKIFAKKNFENIIGFFSEQKIKILKNLFLLREICLVQKKIREAKIDFSKFWFFRSEKNLKIFSNFSSRIFLVLKKYFLEKVFTYVNSKISQDSKNRT